MRDKRLKDLFEQEIEMPDVVQEKMHEAYRQIGADMGKVEKASYRHYISRMGTRYVKAATVLLCALLVTGTVHAATGGGFAKLSGLFKGDTSQIQSSSVKPEVSVDKNTFENLNVSVERVLGTEELTYVLLKVKRTDGKTFDKNMDYHFQLVHMKGENDFDWRGSENEEGSTGATTIMIGGEKKPEVEWEQRSYVEPGIMVENKGTDEIYLAVVCGYEQIKDGVSSYHKGEKCQLKLSGLWGGVDGEEKTYMSGTAETEFVMNYGDCPKKVSEPGKKIQLPKLNSETKYLPAGKLDTVTVTPYYIQYERTLSDKESDNDTWEQIYLEMEDGTKIGYPTFQSWLEPEKGRGGYGNGSDGKFKDCLMFRELIDVEHVKAVYFGKTRIEM